MRTMLEDVVVEGDVVDRQELLNGQTTVTLDGHSSDGAWSASALISWNLGLERRDPEGDLTLSNRDGGEIYTSLTGVDELAAEATPDAEERLRLTFDVDGGAGPLDGAQGRVEGQIEIARDRFTMTLTLTIDVPA
jgi:hypothetical protein